MAEESDLSRTEPASSQRLQEARRAGDVPRSAELTAWLVLLAALGMLGWLAPRLLAALRTLIETALITAAQPFSPVFIEAAQSALWMVFPLLAVILVAALVAPLLLSGWVFAPQRTQFNLLRANPLKPFSRILTADFWFDGSLALLKLVLAVAAIAWMLASGTGLQSLNDLSSSSSLMPAAAWLERGLLALVVALALAPALDAGWRWWRYLRRHAMTWQEVLAEAREAEVNPEIRAQLHGRQQQAGQGESPEQVAPRKLPQSIDEVIG
jgi:flagellar biosynthetic protein FlhB